MISVITLAALAAAAPIEVPACRYISSDGIAIHFLQNGENEVLVTFPAGNSEICVWTRTADDPVFASMMHCDGASAVSGGFEIVEGYMYFMGEIWDQKCGPDRPDDTLA